MAEEWQIWVRSESVSIDCCVWTEEAMADLGSVSIDCAPFDGIVGAEEGLIARQAWACSGEWYNGMGILLLDCGFAGAETGCGLGTNGINIVFVFASSLVFAMSE